MVAHALALTGIALAAPALDPERGDGPEIATAERVRVVLQLGSEPVSVWALVHGDRELLAAGATGRLRTSPLPPHTPIEVVHADDTTTVLPGVRVWTPVDVAAWSGAGLRDARVVDLVPTPRGLWALGRTGGPAVWTGSSWAHIDRRDALRTSAFIAMDVAAGDRWVVHADGVSRIDAEGVLATWEAPSGAVDVLADDDGAWVAGGSGLWRVETAPVQVSPAGPCLRLIRAPTGALAACDVVRELPSARPVAGLGRPAHAVVLRAGGAWMATGEGLVARVGGVDEPWLDAQVTVLERLDDGLLIGGPDGVFLLQEDGLRALHPDDGVRGRAGLATAPHAHPQKAWLGTDRGVSLVTASGAATPLPLAPLAAGVPVRAVVPVGDRAGVATRDGLVWLGRAPPPGWSTLTAATGPRPRDLLHAADDAWWALTEDAALRLDRRGELTRWPVAGGTLGLVQVEQTVGVVTARGLRWWVPDARMLSPTEHSEGLRAAWIGPDGVLWALEDTTLRATTGGLGTTWASPGLTDLAPDRGGAWLATDRGLARLSVADDAAVPVLPDVLGVPLRAVHRAPRSLWVLAADGRLWVLRAGAPTPVPWDSTGAAPDALDVVGDAAGAWLITTDGLYRIALPEERVTGRRSD